MESSVLLGISLPIWAAVLLSLILVLAVTYLFYPAIVAAGEKHRRILLSPVTQIKSHQQQRQEAGVQPQPKESEESAVIVLSIVIPAYNEELRLPVMMQETFDYLTRKPVCQSLENLRQLTTSKTTSATSIAVEWILVDDGSSDRTGLAFSKFVQRREQQQQEQDEDSPRMLWELITLPQNCGKGAAVQAGMMASTGAYCLMVDADGATDFAVGLEALTNKLVSLNNATGDSGKSGTISQPNSNFVIMGSRAHIQQERSVVRRFLAFAFRALLELTLGHAAASIRDTQCGFKLFSRSAAHAIFENLHLQRWAFDIEVLYLAMQFKMVVQEVVVPWHEVEGSKLNTSVWNLAWVSVSMLRDMICVRLCYVLNIWNIKPQKPAVVVTNPQKA